MEALAARLCDGIESVIADARRALARDAARLPVGVPVQPRPAAHRAEAAAAGDDDLDALLHLAMLNRGVLLTPFHNMALMSPATTDAHVDRHTEAFAGIVAELLD